MYSTIRSVATWNGKTPSMLVSEILVQLSNANMTNVKVTGIRQGKACCMGMAWEKQKMNKKDCLHSCMPCERKIDVGQDMSLWESETPTFGPALSRLHRPQDPKFNLVVCLSLCPVFQLCCD